MNNSSHLNSALQVCVVHITLLPHLIFPTSGKVDQVLILFLLSVKKTETGN